MKRKADLRFIGVVEKTDEQESQIRIFAQYCSGLTGIEDFSHLIVLYWFHLRDTEEERKTLLVFPRKHAVNVEKGVFSCRSPSRPNPIGMCAVKLLNRHDCTLTVEGLDALEGSPIVDIKPYLPRADRIQRARTPEWTTHGPAT